MPRAHCPRRIRQLPSATYFKPAGIPLRTLEEIALALDELEALRLADLTALHHETAAEQMGVSRATFGRIVERARRKVADALINGKALRLEGGPVLLPATLPCVLQKTQHSGESKSMKIAAVTDDEKTISPHFGRACGFVILTVENGKVIDRETRRRQNGCDGQGHEQAHDHGVEQAGHHCGELVELIADCAVVLVCRMGGGMYRRLQAAGIRPVFTELMNIDEAVRALLEGTLSASEPNLCH
ncbi:MAG TPA: DUF134 domain-containing protein [Verrucomicrobiae bacterium]|nr:DUF134 domain-containing protein [Verrucomicrobiae bacterium]